MRTFHWSRKLLGRTIKYSVEAEEDKETRLLCISVYCLQPNLLFDMLSNTPQLIGKQLLNLAMDAADQVRLHSLLLDISSHSYTEKQINLFARFAF
jgi:hypothetical protein